MYYIRKRIRNFLIQRPYLWKYWRKYRVYEKSRRTEKTRYQGKAKERLNGLEYLLERCEGKTVLDIGCSDGLIDLEFSKSGISLIHGIEIETSAVEDARKNFEGLSLNYKFIQGDLALSKSEFEKKYAEFLEEKYDIVLFLAVYHHLKYQMSSKGLQSFVENLFSKVSKWLAIRGNNEDLKKGSPLSIILERQNFKEVHTADRNNPKLGIIKIFERI
tara:strand:+ start:307 stop:957 length:651 start_codon:yes stop_codon:yes gene_type:complete